MADKDAKDTGTAKVAAGAQSEQGLKAERGEVKMENQIAPLVASPTGPMPLSAFVADEEEAEIFREEREEQLQAERDSLSGDRELDEETLDRMSAAERRAVATDRGYRTEGRRMSTRHFLALQEKDEELGRSAAGRRTAAKSK